MLKFTKDCRPKAKTFAMCITKKGYIYGGQVSYEVNRAGIETICFMLFINESETSTYTNVDNIVEWMPSPELEKYYHF